MLSRYGKTVRKLRIDKGVPLKAMAEALGKSSAYLSAVETGRKNPPETLVLAVADYFGLSDTDRDDLIEAAQESRSQVNIPMEGFNDSRRHVAAAFARQLATLTEEELQQIHNLLEKNLQR